MEAQQYLGIMAGMQLQYAALCDDPKCGIAAVDKYGVHVTQEFFVSTFAARDVTMCLREGYRFMYEYAAFSHGVRFFCLSERELI